jgi:hypothetical protein
MNRADQYADLRAEAQSGRLSVVKIFEIYTFSCTNVTESNYIKYSNLQSHVHDLKFAGLRAMGVQGPLAAPIQPPLLQPKTIFREKLEHLFECGGLLEVSR